MSRCSNARSRWPARPFPPHGYSCVRALNAHDLVMLPAEDGGYALIGGHRLPARLFTDMAWGGSEVAAQTHARARELGLRVACPGTVWDLDTPRDLERWRMLDAAT